jgi:trans-2,3-dihydro-3-hydroxyanthranilate isomerase
VADWSYVLCDVFTDRPLAGNQLAVFPAAAAIPDALLQPLAREINFSETVFVYPPAGDGDAKLRIFTPSAEIRFAGHPVLGAAVVLGGELGRDEVRLETGAGLVPVALERDGHRVVFGRMSQPIPSVSPFAREDQLLAALGVERSRLPVELYDNGLQHVYVVLDGEDAVARLQPDVKALIRLARETTMATMGINCFAGGGRRWKTRMFAPADGVPEDPATGSAAGPLACHLVRHGLVASGQEIEISQGAEIGRPSTLTARAEVVADRIERVEVGGGALIVARGAFDPSAITSS